MPNAARRPAAAPAAAPLLVVEDSDEDYAALRWALGKVGVDRPVQRLHTGAELLASLRASARGDAPAPALVLLDLNLGADDGREVLAELKADAALRRVPVVVWTTSAHPGDVAACYDHGANGYATKPVDVAQLVASLRDVTQYWFGCMVLPEAAAGAPARVSARVPLDAAGADAAGRGAAGGADPS